MSEPTSEFARRIGSRVAEPGPGGSTAMWSVSHPIALLLGTGFVGAFTTFSTWMFETERLTEERQIRPAIANIVVSVVLGIAAAAAGQAIAVRL